MTTVREFVHAHRDSLRIQLGEFVRIPSVSGQPERHADVQRSAEWLAQACRATGFPTVEIWPTPGLPAVFAEWPSEDPDAPTVVVYGHHDVQPVDPIEMWDTEPFELTTEGDVLRARGASDDKGQLLFHLLGLRAHLAAMQRTSPAVTIKLLIEGEEESGSPNLPRLLAERRDRLDCDVIVVTDSAMIAPDVPSTLTGLRGLVAATVSFHGPDLDLHSGAFGGAVPNPATAIARLVGALHDPNGRVQVAGFSDDAVELSDTERELLARVPTSDAEFLRTAKSRAVAGEGGFTTLERIGARPTAEVNGIWGGYLGAGAKTIVPSDAHAKLSFRLVAHQDPAKIRAAVDEFVETHRPQGVESTTVWEGDGVAACLIPLGTPAYDALTAAISEAFDGLPVLPTREGGSGPEAGLQATLRAPMVFLGFGLPDDQIHAPNEKVDLSMLCRGAEAAAHLWRRLGQVGRAGLASLADSKGRSTSRPGFGVDRASAAPVAGGPATAAGDER
jgi:acetylornithine deacetylase/succinyl-diaminopimelate desuccinylase-like protein